MVTEEDRQLGLNIRELRRQRGMTMAQLGDAVGVSKSMISQIEHGKAHPSIRVLRMIARELGVPLFMLLADDEVGNSLVRRHERRELPLPGSNITRELLVPDLHRRIILLAARFAPGDTSSDTPSGHLGEECVYVISGQLEVEVNSSRIMLDSGDCYYLESRLPHRFTNNSDDVTEIIVAISPSLPV